MNIRRTRRALAFFAVAGATVLATAACGPDDTGAAADPAASTSAGSSPEKSPAASEGTGAASQQSGGASGGKGGTSGSGAGKDSASGGQGDGSNAADATCSTDGLDITVDRAGGTLPAVIIKATNTAGGSCNIYGFPTVGYPGAQAAIGAYEESKPQAVVTLAPGKSAYAALTLSNDGPNMHREKSLTIGLLGKDMGPIDGQATVTTQGVAITDDSTVSYWQSSQADALQ